MQITKSIGLLLTVTLVASCNGKKEEQTDFGKPQQEEKTATPAVATSEMGKELFEGKGTCATCHKPDVKLVGPSLQDIAKTYKEKGLSVAAFINEESKPAVDPSQYEVMKANFVVTKAMKPEERQALEDYIMSFAK